MKLGLLSTARINQRAILQALPFVQGVTVECVAARAEFRARQFAEAHGIRHSYSCYDDLLDDPDIDAVYIPLPNSMHFKWAGQALKRGKHVLCEKPLCLDPHQVTALQTLARENGLVLMEAMHYRYHPDVARLVMLVDCGLLGRLQKISISFEASLTGPGDIRLQAALAGGALADIGCYCVDFIRWLSGDSRPKLLWAEMASGPREVETSINCALLCHEQVHATFDCNIDASSFKCVAKLDGDRDAVTVESPFLPAVNDPGSAELFFSVQSAETGPLEWLRTTDRPSYAFQLAAFCEAIDTGTRWEENVKAAAVNARILSSLANKACATGFAPLWYRH
jgi:predicted dehydrogenase